MNTIIDTHEIVGVTKIIKHTLCVYYVVYIMNTRNVVLEQIVDPEFYLHTNIDVKAAGVDPVHHYSCWGWKENRWPNPLFDPAFVKKRYLFNEGVDVVMKCFDIKAKETCEDFWELIDIAGGIILVDHIASQPLPFLAVTKCDDVLKLARGRRQGVPEKIHVNKFNVDLFGLCNQLLTFSSAIVNSVAKRELSTTTQSTVYILFGDIAPDMLSKSRVSVEEIIDLKNSQAAIAPRCPNVCLLGSLDMCDRVLGGRNNYYIHDRGTPRWCTFHENNDRRRQCLYILQNLVFSDKWIQKSLQIASNKIPQSVSYNSIHWRFEIDWLIYNVLGANEFGKWLSSQKSNTENGDKQSVQVASEIAQRALSIAVSSGLINSSISTFLKAVKSYTEPSLSVVVASGLRVTEFNNIAESELSYQSILDMFGESNVVVFDKTVKPSEREFSALVDLIIAERAESFVGCCGSTFSHLIHLRRKCRGKKSVLVNVDSRIKNDTGFKETD